MKKLILVVAFTLIGFTGFSQEDFRLDTMKLMQINGSSASLDVAKKQVLKMIPEAKHADFNKDFETTLPTFYKKMAEVMMDVYTHDEVLELIKFYETPLGKKMAEKAGIVQEKSMQAGQEWGMELQGILMKYME